MLQLDNGPCSINGLAIFHSLNKLTRLILHRPQLAGPFNKGKMILLTMDQSVLDYFDRLWGQCS